jgi:hypothetical protein
VVQSVERNRGRLEARAVAGFPVLAIQAGFPFATFAGKVSRAWDQPGRSKEGHYEELWLLASHAKSTATRLLFDNRKYWAIEGVLHQRLDCSRLDEDRSRVRTPNNLLNLAMFRRVAVCLALAWGREQPNPRLATTNGFIDAMRRNNARPALSLALSTRSVARRTLRL